MINSALYRQPALLDAAQHRGLKIGTLADFSITAGMHGVFLAVSEIPQAAVEFPVVFIATGEKNEAGKPVISPIALLGLSQNENLFVDGARWTGRYIPAFIRRYPFLTANLRGGAIAGPGVMIDEAWAGLSRSEGEPLFGADDKPAPALQRAIEFLERFEIEAQRTRNFCARLAEFDLLREMQADATLPDGLKVSVDGFFVVDEEKLLKLPDLAVIEMHRNGMLSLLNLHLASMHTMRGLVERKALRLQAARATA